MEKSEGIIINTKELLANVSGDQNMAINMLKTFETANLIPNLNNIKLGIEQHNISKITRGTNYLQNITKGIFPSVYIATLNLNAVLFDEGMEEKYCELIIQCLKLKREIADILAGLTGNIYIYIYNLGEFQKSDDLVPLAKQYRTQLSFKEIKVYHMESNTLASECSSNTESGRLANFPTKFEGVESNFKPKSKWCYCIIL